MKINRRFNPKEIKIKLMIVCSLLAVIVLSFFFAENLEKFFGLNETYAKHQISQSDINACDYKVCYLDVGQGNSTFVKFPDGKTMLIDAGNVVSGATIVNYLKEEGVDVIDFVIATHSDADHVGGFLEVFNNFEIKNIYRPFQIAGKMDAYQGFIPNVNEDLAEIYSSYIEETGNRSKISKETSNVYNSFIDLVYKETYEVNQTQKLSNIYVFYDGLKIVGENYSLEFFAPLVRENLKNILDFSNRTNGYATIGYGADETNGNSAIMLLSIFEETFLFTGDAPFESSSENVNKNQTFAEMDFLNSLTAGEKLNFSNLSVLLLGHHGSANSTSEALLKLTCPKFAVVSVGSNNDYGHPSSEVLYRLEQFCELEQNKPLRTDKDGNITFSSKGGEVVYSISNFEHDKDLTISWYELGTIIFLSISYIVVIIKPKQPKRF